MFQEKFKDFEVTPNDAVWDRIEAELHGKKKKRRVIPIWWRVAGVAALLLLMFTVGNAIFNTDDQGTQPVVDTESQEGQNTVDPINSEKHSTTSDDDLDLQDTKLAEESLEDNSEDHASDDPNATNPKGVDQGSEYKPNEGVASNTKDNGEGDVDGQMDYKNPNKAPLYNKTTNTKGVKGTDKIKDALAANDYKPKKGRSWNGCERDI